jgi:hypothetical protein
MSHELPWGTAWVAEADLATYVKELEKRPQRQQALITRMLAEAGDGKDRSLARLLLLQDKKVGTQRHRHTGEKRAVPLKDSARERYKRASEIRSGRSWDRPAVLLSAGQRRLRAEGPAAHARPATVEGGASVGAARGVRPARGLGRGHRRADRLADGRRAARGARRRRVSARRIVVRG